MLQVSDKKKDLLTSCFFSLFLKKLSHWNKKGNLLYSAPCRSLCETVNRECGELFKSVNYPFLNCQDVDLQTGKEKYPESQLNFTIEGKTYSVECNNVKSSGKFFYKKD